MNVSKQFALRFGVLSDIHATVFESGKEAKSFVTVPAECGKRNPLTDLHALLSDRVKLDYLLCPGDITNQANPEAMSWMWDELQVLKAKSNAKELWAVCGNHDVDSRYAKNLTDDPDPKGVLLDLNSPFPPVNPHEVNHFWARNYVLIERTTPFPHRALLLNTCAYHGGAENELQHGRISSRTIKRIQADLAKLPPVYLNVLLCHHHLEPLPSWNNSPDYQFVKKGGELLRALEDSCVGPWLVVHGHRHWPECFYAAGGNASAVVFCSSSFGARDAQIANQFHVLNVEVDGNISRPKGRIETFTWTLGMGWSAGPTADIPSLSKALSHLSGFGFNGNLNGLATKVNTFIGTQPRVNWEDVTRSESDLNYLLPREFSQLKTLLNRLNIGIFEENGIPIEAGRKSK
jgi:hypothetical protein